MAHVAEPAATPASVDLAGCGVVMVATRRDAYVVLAASCARSVRHHATELPITLYTNVRSIPPEHLAPFTDVVEMESPTRSPVDWANGLMDKLRGIRCSPYERTLLLDVDTVVRSAAVVDAFAMLEEHDLLISECVEDASASLRLLGRPIYNTGVVGYRRNDRVNRLLGAWTDFGLETLALARDGRLGELADLAHLTPEQRTFVGLTDQYTLARYLAPGVNAFDVRVMVLEERWNFRGDGRREPPEDLIVDHRMMVKRGEALFGD